MGLKKSFAQSLLNDLYEIPSDDTAKIHQIKIRDQTLFLVMKYL